MSQPIFLHNLPPFCVSFIFHFIFVWKSLILPVLSQTHYVAEDDLQLCENEVHFPGREYRHAPLQRIQRTRTALKSHWEVMTFIATVYVGPESDTLRH